MKPLTIQISCFSILIIIGLIYICWVVFVNNHVAVEATLLSRRRRSDDQYVFQKKSHNRTVTKKSKPFDTYLLFKKNDLIEEKIVDALWTSKPIIRKINNNQVIKKEAYTNKDVSKGNDSDTKKGRTRTLNVKKDSGTTPINAEAVTDPVTTVSPTTPLTTEAVTSPVTTVSATTPLTTEAVTSPVTTMSATTPLTTEAVTSPVTTMSVTTPLTTEAVTSPVTTMSVTTPITTEASYKEVTTEATQAESDDEPNDTIQLIRRRRQAQNPTPTTPDPTTTTAAVTCTSPGYSGAGSNGCQCPPGRNPVSCLRGNANQERARLNTIELTKTAIGEFESTDANRYQIQQQIEQHYFDAEIPNFQRVYVNPLVAANGRTRISYIVIFSTPVGASTTAQAAGATADIISHNLPINLNGQQLQFEGSATLVAPNVNEDPIEIEPATINENVCYTYNTIGACKNGGSCGNKGGKPTCICSSDQYYGEYCDIKVLYPDDTDDKMLAILLPVASGLSFLVLCTCLIAALLRRRKGDHEEAPSEYDVKEADPVPAYFLSIPRVNLHPRSWSNFSYDPAPESDPSEPSIYREPIYRYQLHDSSGSYSTSSDSIRGNGRRF